MKLKVNISLFETVRLSVSISQRNLYNSLKSIKENWVLQFRVVKSSAFLKLYLVVSLTDGETRELKYRGVISCCILKINLTYASNACPVEIPCLPLDIMTVVKLKQLP